MVFYHMIECVFYYKMSVGIIHMKPSSVISGPQKPYHTPQKPYHTGQDWYHTGQKVAASNQILIFMWKWWNQAVWYRVLKNHITLPKNHITLGRQMATSDLKEAISHEQLYLVN